MDKIEQNIFFPLIVAFLGFLGFQFFSYFRSKARKLRIAEELERVTQIKQEISHMVEEKNEEQNRQIDSFNAALQEFSKVIIRFEHSTNDIIQLTKRMNEDLAGFKSRLTKLEKRMEQEFKAVDKVIRELSNQVLKIQTTHNFCHPGKPIHNNSDE